MGRRLLRAAALAALLATVPGAVLAHPLGNFTINHYAGIVVAGDEIRLDVVIDMAEIPAFQERQRIDLDEDGQVSDEEAAAEAPRACALLRDQLRLDIDGERVALSVTRTTLDFPAGLGGLPTMRLECTFVAPVALSDDPTSIAFADASYPDRVGWREIVVAGNGTAVDAGQLPPTSVSERLTAYPDDLLEQPLDVREASFTARASAGGAASPSAEPATGGAGIAAVPGGIGDGLPAIFQSADLTPFVVLVSLLLALGLGAQHALTPGHGKTLMAAYLVGTRGRPRHAVGLGLAVSVSHTLGILALTAVVVGAQGVLPAEVVVEAAPVVAAVTIAGVGGWMLVSELRRRRRAAASVGAGHDHPAAAGHGDDHGHATHAHDHEHEHEHVAGGHAHDHGGDGHAHDDAPSPTGLEHSHGGVRHSHLPPPGSSLGWRGLFALGLAGGLIPSTSALFILLTSIVAGRPAFGFVLVVAFGLGMAAVMTGVGLAIVYARSRIDGVTGNPRLRRLASQAPLLAAIVVFAFGLYLTAQAVAGQTVL